MPEDLALLLPVLSGYFFLHFSHWLKFRAQTLHGERLVIEAITLGAAFAATGRLLTYWVAECEMGRSIATEFLKARMSGRT